MEIITTGITTITALCIGITEAIKRVGLPSKYSPLISLVIGIGLSFLSITDTMTNKILTGIMCGLMASGLYSMGNSTYKEIKKGQSVITNNNQ